MARTVTGALGVATLLCALATGTPGAGAHQQDGNLPGGTTISVDIQSPAAGSIVADSAAHPVTVEGTAAVGEGVADADTTLVSVIDLSGSTDVGGGCGGDANADGSANFILDCEVAALRALNQAAIAAGSIDEVGVVAFASSASIADVGPGAGTQPLTQPTADANSNSVVDVEEVLRSAYSDASGGNGGLRLFTNTPVGQFTSFPAAVQRACQLTQLASNSTVQVVMVSDGISGAGNAVSQLPCGPQVATFFTIAAGSASSCTTGGATNSLAAIAAATGGTCTRVADISELPDVLPDLIGSQLLALEISVDGLAPVPVAQVVPAPPLDGPASVTWSHDLDLAPGVHTVCVTASGSDFGGTGSATDCHEVSVATIGLSPATAVNDLSSDTSHTVTATVTAGADGGLPGVEVDFEVVTGPSAPVSGSGTTGSSGTAELTWTNPSQDLSGLGTDAVRACFTDSLGNELCADATKDWRDLTAPVASCAASVNPAGNAPKGAQPGGVTRSHGFFVLGAEDALDPEPEIAVRDLGSGHVFGPFASGTTLKWTQSGSGPAQKAMAGPGSAVLWHLTGTGDAEVTATDASGNTSAPVVCAVPSS